MPEADAAGTVRPVAPRTAGGPVVAAAAVVATAMLVLTWAVATRRPVPEWELDLEEWFNRAPDWTATVLWPVMQSGTVASPLVLALVLLIWSRRWVLAIVVVVAGLTAWYGAKGIKELVQRGRPLEYVPIIDVREGAGTGLGYVSGHSTVAATVAVILVAVLPPRWRWVPVVVAALVGVARLVYGVHLPADVVGGWATGALIGLAALALVGLVGRARPAGDPEGAA